MLAANAGVNLLSLNCFSFLYQRIWPEIFYKSEKINDKMGERSKNESPENPNRDSWIWFQAQRKFSIKYFCALSTFMSARLNADAAFFYLAFSLIPGKAAQTKPSQMFLLLRPWWMGNNFNEILARSCLEISFLRSFDCTKSDVQCFFALSDYLAHLAQKQTNYTKFLYIGKKWSAAVAIVTK